MNGKKKSDFCRQIGANIKERREQLGLTLAQCAELAGMSQGTFQKYETGNIQGVTVDRVADIARVLKTDPDSLTGWKSSNTGASKSRVYSDGPLLRAIDQYYTLSEKEQKLVLDLIDALAQNK